MNFLDMTYDFPSFGYLMLGVLFLLGLFYWQFYSRNRSLSSFFCASDHAKKNSPILIARLPLLFFVKAILLSVAWVFAVLALMGPRSYADGLTGIMERKRAPHEVFIVIDQSASMAVKDGADQKSRLDYTKNFADELVANLKGQEVSLYGFTSEFIPNVPLTHDYLFTRFSIDQLTINEGGTAGTSLFEAFKGIHRAVTENPARIQKTVILLTDGGDTLLESLKGAALEQKLKELENVLKLSAQNNLKFYLIGVGSKKGAVVPGILDGGAPVVSVLEERWLKELAQAVQGEYVEGFSDFSGSIAVKIANEIDAATLQETVEVQNQETGSFKSYYQYPLGFALLSLLLSTLLPTTLRKKVKQGSAVLLFAFQMLGSDLVDALEKTLEKTFEKEQRQMVEAEAFLYVGEYAKALNIYQNMLQTSRPSWQKAVLLYNSGAALTAGGNLESAQRSLSAVPYNLGIPLDSLLKYRVDFVKTLIRLVAADRKIEEDPDSAAKELLELSKQLTQLSTLYCRIQKAKGATECSNSYELAQVENLLRQKIALAHKKQEEWLFTHLGLEKAIPLLISSIDYLIEKNNFLQQLSSDKNVLKQYLELDIRLFKEVAPFWFEIEEGLKKREKSIELEPLRRKAYEQFTKASEMIHQERYKESNDSLTESIAGLKELLGKLPPPPPPATSQKPELDETPPPIDQQNKKNEEEEKTIRLLLQMNQQDKKPKKVQPIQTKSGLKPW